MKSRKTEIKEILFDEGFIGNPFVMKELILRGYRINSVSPSSYNSSQQSSHQQEYSIISREQISPNN